jgi:putative ABC transport system permease protein
MSWILFALRNTLRNRRRSLVTVAIAALGTAAILLAGGFALFSYQGLEQSSARDTGHLTLADARFFDREEATPLELGLGNYDEIRERLLAIPDVRYVLPRVQFSGLISNGDKSVVALGIGIDPAAEFKVRGPFLTVHAGETLDGTEPADRPAVMLGDGLARQLKVAPGDGVTLLASTSEGALNALDVRIKGIFSTGIPEIDKRLVYTDVPTAQELVAAERVSTVGIYLRRLDLTDSVQLRVARLFGDRYAVKTWREQAVFYLAVRSLYNRIFGSLGTIITVIVLFVTANAMAMAIIERTREIGTLRALGTLPGQLVRVLALEGATLGGVGALLGTLIALGFSIALLFAGIEMPPAPGRSTGYPLQIAISPTLYALAIVTITGLSMVCAAVIASRTANKPVVEALGHV